MRTSKALKLDSKFYGAIWTSPHAQRLMEALSYDIGPRPSGSKAMRRAARLVAETLAGLGAENVHTEAVPVLAWQGAPSCLELLRPSRRPYQCIQHVHSASGKVSAPLLDAGMASREEIDRLGRKAEGSVLLLYGHEISGGKFVPLHQRVRNIVERGAVGAIVRTMAPGVGPAIELMGVSQVLPIPVLGVSCEDGHELASYARRGRARVRMDAGGASYRARCVNLIADMCPARPTDEMIILSAHLDSLHIAPCAFDNLSGVVTLIEIARALAPLRHSFRRRLRLIAFTGEEYGFVGSKSYVRRHAGELDSVRFVFNMDSLFPSTAEGMAVMWSPAMRDYIDRALSHAPSRVEVRDYFCMSSDYLPFMLEGIAAARPADWKNSFPVWSHTFWDTPDKVPPEWIRANVMAHAPLLARMLMDPAPLPARRKSREEVQRLVAREGVQEALRSFEFDVPSVDAGKDVSV